MRKRPGKNKRSSRAGRKKGRKLDGLVFQDGFQQVAAREDREGRAEVDQQRGVGIDHFHENPGGGIQLLDPGDHVECLEVRVLKPGNGEDEDVIRRRQILVAFDWPVSRGLGLIITSFTETTGSQSIRQV
jgi:hypothetical protein